MDGNKYTMSPKADCVQHTMDGEFAVVQSLTMEQELDSYKEKVEHFKELIRKLQDDLQHFKTRAEGADMVFKLLQENRVECVSLKKKTATCESVIRNLQSRLEANGLSSDIVLQEGETYIPGHSKTLLDNLTRENGRLRNLVRSQAGDPEEFARIQQLNEELVKERNHLQNHIAELDKVLRSSDKEKDKVINGLNEQHKHMEHELASRDGQIRTLSEEIRSSQKQLAEVVQQCHELARKAIEPASQDKIAQEHFQTRGADHMDYAAISDENKMLKSTIKEITEMNRRWQQFHAQREETIGHLNNKIKQLDQQVKETDKARQHLEHETNLGMNRVLDESRRVNCELEDQKRHTTRVAGDRDRYKRDLDNAEGQIRALKAELTKLKNGSGGSCESIETINALKAQIQICTEDFESERHDRERAQEKVNRLETEAEHLRKEMEALHRHAPQWNVHQNSQNDMVYYQPQPVITEHEKLAARGPTDKNFDKYNVIDGISVQNEDAIVMPMYGVSDNQTERMSSPDVHNVTSTTITTQAVQDHTTLMDDAYVSLNITDSSLNDSCTGSDTAKDRMSPRMSPRHDSPAYCESNSERNADNTELLPRSSPRKTDEVLRCPTCNKIFTLQEHSDLMFHMEECCD